MRLHVRACGCSYHDDDDDIDDALHVDVLSTALCMMVCVGREVVSMCEIV